MSVKRHIFGVLSSSNELGDFYSTEKFTSYVHSTDYDALELRLLSAVDKLIELGCTKKQMKDAGIVE